MPKPTKAQEKEAQEAKRKKLKKLFDEYRGKPNENKLNEDKPNDELTTCQFLQQLVQQGFCTAGDLKTKFNKSVKEIEACVKNQWKTGIPNDTREKGIREILEQHGVSYRPSTRGDKSHRPQKTRRSEKDRPGMRA